MLRATMGTQLWSSLYREVLRVQPQALQDPTLLDQAVTSHKWPFSPPTYMQAHPPMWWHCCGRKWAHFHLLCLCAWTVKVSPSLQHRPLTTCHTSLHESVHGSWEWDTRAGPTECRGSAVVRQGPGDLGSNPHSAVNRTGDLGTVTISYPNIPHRVVVRRMVAWKLLWASWMNDNINKLGLCWACMSRLHTNHFPETM